MGELMSKKKTKSVPRTLRMVMMAAVDSGSGCRIVVGMLYLSWWLGRDVRATRGWRVLAKGLE
jgi:hypothetical protein